MSGAPEQNDHLADPANMLEVDFALVVNRLIDAAKNDPAQLRSSIYELARRNLLEQVTLEDGQEQRKMLEALETAIKGVEAFSQRQESKALAALPPPPQGGFTSRHLAVADRLPVPPSAPALSEPEIQGPRRGFARRAAMNASPDIVQVKIFPARGTFLVRTVVVVSVLAVSVSGIAYVRQNPNLFGGTKAASADVPPAAARPNKAGPQGQASAAVDPNAAPAKSALLPDTFGIYAVSGDKLFELEQLPGRVPDARVAVSAAITSPSRAILPDGKVRFIVYRRDSIANAPDRAEIRVIAKITSAMTFANAGKATVAATDDTWVMRNISIGFRVAPVRENAEMYEIRNESDSFVLSPGRYALVIKGAAYDFTVDGKVTDPNHCLQRIEAANGSFYSPCQKL